MLCFLNGRNVANDGTKPVTLLGSQTSVREEFIPQFDKVTIGTTVDTLGIELDQEKYEEFLHTNSLSYKQMNNTFGMARSAVNYKCRQLLEAKSQSINVNFFSESQNILLNVIQKFAVIHDELR